MSQRQPKPCGRFANIFCALAACWSLAWLFTISGVAHADPVPGGVELQLPAGYVAEVVAGSPLVERPIMAGFDDRGRLYVAESAGLNLPFNELETVLPNFIRRLEDTDGDGKFDKSTIFADQLTFPQGAVWYRGALYVCSPPFVWKFEDDNDDGIADRRTPLVGTFGSSGNAADIHGGFLGNDGRIYWCDGRHGHDFPESNGKPGSKGFAARVFSCMPDGSDARVFCGGGMDNPVEVTFLPTGEMIGTMTFYNPDEERHDAIVHFVHGGVYPKKHECLSEFKRTGDLMPAVSIFGVVAPSGVTYFRGNSLGNELKGSLFSCQFNTHKIVRHELVRVGASYVSKDSDFAVSPVVDFHPTDVLEDTDGSLLVVDTGGWFRIGCPTSQLAKPEALGAIYRIRRADIPPTESSKRAPIAWSTLGTDDLLKHLQDERPLVRDRALDELAQRGTRAIGPLESAVVGKDPHLSMNALWALARMRTAEACPAIRKGLSHENVDVRQTAAQCVGVCHDLAAESELCRMVLQDELPVRREAATTLGKIGGPNSIESLLTSLRTAGDRFVEHALIFALIEINDRELDRIAQANPASAAGASSIVAKNADANRPARDKILAGLADNSPLVRRGALIALDQSEGSFLTRDQVISLLESDDVTLQQSAMEVIQKHPDWAGEVLSQLEGWLREVEAKPELAAMIKGALAAFESTPEVQQFVGTQLANATNTNGAKMLLLEVMARCELNPFPEAWIPAIESAVNSQDPVLVQQAVLTASAFRLGSLAPALLKVSADKNVSSAVRVSALQGWMPGAEHISEDQFELLLSQLREEIPPAERMQSAAAIAAAPLKDEQLTRLTDVIKGSGSLEMRTLLRAFERSNAEAIGVSLVDSLLASPGAQGIPVGSLENLLNRYPESVRKRGEPLLASLQVDRAAQRERLIALEARLINGDVQRGKQVFQGKRASCIACHKTGDQGGNTGPNLSKIGEARNRRDLLEAVLYPSSTFARGFETIQIVIQDGTIVTGVLGRETASALYLRTADRTEVRVPRNQIEEIGTGTISVMPQGLEKLLTEEELSDLLTYLQSLK